MNSSVPGRSFLHCCYMQPRVSLYLIVRTWGRRVLRTRINFRYHVTHKQCTTKIKHRWTHFLYCINRAVKCEFWMFMYRTVHATQKTRVDTNQIESNTMSCSVTQFLVTSKWVATTRFCNVYDLICHNSFCFCCCNVYDLVCHNLFCFLGMEKQNN